MEPSNIHWSSALKDLNEEEVGIIERHLTVRDVPARTPVFLRGDPADTLFIIRSGRVRLARSLEAGDEFTTGIWSSGYIIGLISAFLGVPRFLAAETLDQVTLQTLKSSDLHECMRTIPQFTLNIAHLLALLASDSIERSALLALEPVEARLGRILVKLAVPLSPDAPEKGYVVRGITQDELARMVGASRPWVNRALADFEKRQLIRCHKQLISILDLDACKRLQMD
jgi:CRP-like cAMP-binding protein